MLCSPPEDAFPFQPCPGRPWGPRVPWLLKSAAHPEWPPRVSTGNLCKRSPLPCLHLFSVFAVGDCGVGPLLFPLLPAPAFVVAPSRAASYFWNSGLQPDHPTLVPGELVARSRGTETPKQWKVPSGSLETV